MSGERSAKEIYQEALDVGSKALWSGDYEAVARTAAFPYTMATRTTLATFEDAESLTAMLRDLRGNFANVGATDLIRICREAHVSADDPDRIVGRHTSYTMRGGMYAVPPYDSAMEMVRTPEGWRICFISSDIDDRHVTIVERVERAGTTAGASPTDPRRVYQDLIDKLTDAIVRRDAETFIACNALPQQVVTVAGQRIFETEGDLLESLNRFVHAIEVNGVTHVVRVCVHARALGPEHIEGWHKTYILRGANLVYTPHVTRQVLRHEDGLWRVAEIEAEVDHGVSPSSTLWPVPGAFTERWRQKVGDARSGDIPADTLYRAFLDALAAASEALDLDAWTTLFDYPHAMHLDGTTTWFTTAEEKRKDLETLMEAEKGLAPGIRSVERGIERAVLTKADELIGYHLARLLRGGETVGGPYAVRTVLRLTDAGWRCRHSTIVTLTPEQITSGRPLADILPKLRQLEGETDT